MRRFSPLPIRRLLRYALPAALLFAGCRPSVTEKEPEAVAEVTYHKAPIRLSYETESITVTEPTSKNPKVDYLYQIGSRPHIPHNKVHVDISEDGSGEWLIESLEPSPQWRLPSPQAEIPQDDSPKTARTHIKNGAGYFFDKDSKLIRTHAIPSQNYVELVALLKADQKRAKENVAARIIAGSNIDVNQRIAEAQAKGYEVTYQAGGLVTIRYAVTRNMLNPGNPTTPRLRCFTTLT